MCEHEAYEKDTAVEADGMCPLCMATDLAALRERVTELENQNKWWLENYDITMPCGHKNRYLATRGNGELVLDDAGNALCLICSMEEAQ